jgi:putative ABC transport system substrate-binding protein
VLSFLADPIAPIQVKAMEEAARRLGLTLQVQDIRAADDIQAAYEAGSRTRTEGVLVTEESMFIVHRARLTEFAVRYKLPAVYPFLLPVTDAGGLMAYAVRAPELHRNAAVYVDRILKGAKVSNLPVQQPTKFDLVINLKTAKALGIDVPPTLLARADEVIE